MSSEQRAASENRFGRSWAPAVILIFGAVSLALLLGTNWIRERLVVTDTVRLGALVELQLTAATVHLWLEEYVTGDEVEVANISDGLERAYYLISTVIDGGSAGGVGTKLPPLGDLELESVASRVANHLERFAEISRMRQRGFDAGQDVGIGSSFDVAYDHVFDSLQSETRILEASVRARLGENSRLAQQLFRIILVSWVAIVALAVTGLWTHDRRRRRAQQALATSKAQLIQAQKMEAVGRLAGGITHDINNYLAAITANCELVQMQTEADGPVARKMDAVLEVVSKASSLIERLLAFSRRQPVQAEVVSLNQVVTGLDTMMQRLVGADIQLDIALHEPLWKTQIDPSQVEQILVNLLVNARQAMRKSGTIKVETDNVVLDESFTASDVTMMPGEYAMLAVTDTGPGIAPELLDKIFEPFFTTREQSANSGLGLATVYGIARQNHGSVWVDSEPGAGATFKVYLPRSMAKELKDTLGTPVPVREGGNECILLVEDNDDFRESAATLLVELGYRVLTAPDGAEALRIYESNRTRIDIVLTDVVMPGMSGQELVDTISSRGSQLRVLYMSGFSENVIRHGFADGRVDLLQKPFSADNLDHKIREILSTDPVA